MFMLKFALGAIIIIFGAYSTLTGNVLIRKKSKAKYTEESLRMYTELSGILHMLIGVSIMLFNFGHTSQNIILTSWLFLSVTWIAIAANITLYLIALVKK